MNRKQGMVGIMLQKVQQDLVEENFSKEFKSKGNFKYVNVFWNI